MPSCQRDRIGHILSRWPCTLVCPCTVYQLTIPSRPQPPLSSKYVPWRPTLSRQRQCEILKVEKGQEYGNETLRRHLCHKTLVAAAVSGSRKRTREGACPP